MQPKPIRIIGFIFGVDVVQFLIMAKKKKNTGGRPPKPAGEKLDTIYGVRFRRSEAEEIKLATNYDESLVGRIREAILSEVRKKPPRKKPKPVKRGQS